MVRLCCAECELRPATLLCAHCGGLAFCSVCSSHLHSKKARAHHRVQSICSTLQEQEVGCENLAFSTVQAAPEYRQPFKETYPNKALPADEKHDNKPEKSSLSSKRHKKSYRASDSASRKRSEKTLLSGTSVPSEERAKVSPRRNPKRAVVLKPRQSAENLRSSSSDEGDKLNSSSSEGDESYGIKKYHRGSVTLEAFVVDADSHEIGHTSEGTHPEHQGQAEGGIQERIRKMLELGLHPDTPEIEAQQALKNAQRLLTKHNLRQAEVMKGSLRDNDALSGGMRMVELRYRETNRQYGRFEQWVYSLAHTIAEYFDTQHFVQRHSLLQVVFYGIKQNSDCAGYAFAAIFNRITKLSADYIPSKMADPQKVGKGGRLCFSHSAYSRVSRMSYKNGIVAGLMDTVQTSKYHQKANVHVETREKGTEVKNIFTGAVVDAIHLVSCSSDDMYSSAEDSDGSNNGYFRKDKAADIRHWDHVDSQNSKDDKSAAVSALVVHSKKVGDDFLKENKIKVRQRKVNCPTIWDGEAFLKGKKDSKTIDIGQRGITGKARRPCS